MALTDSERSSGYRQRKKAAAAEMAATVARREREAQIVGALLGRLFRPAPKHLLPAQSSVLAYILTETGHDLDRHGMNDGRIAMRAIVERHSEPRQRHLSIEDSRALRKRLLDPETYCRHAPATPPDSCVTRTDCNATTPMRIADGTRDDTTSDAEKGAESLLAELGRVVFGPNDFEADMYTFLDDETGLPVCLLPGQEDDEELDEPELVEARNKRDATDDDDETDESGGDLS